MVTIKCNCEHCTQNDRGDYWCFRLHDFIDSENKEFCKKYLKNGKAATTLQTAEDKAR